MFVRVDHVELVTWDFERSLLFYVDVLGFQVVERMLLQNGPLKEIAYLRLGDDVIELMSYEGVAEASTAPVAGWRAIALEVESMEATVAHLSDKSVALTWGPMDLGNSIRAEITDPDGVAIELREWRQRPW